MTTAVWAPKCEKCAIVADHKGSYPGELLALPQLVQVEQHLFLRVKAAFLAALDGMRDRRGRTKDRRLEGDGRKVPQ